MTSTSHVLIASAKDLRPYLDHLDGVNLVGLDTETYWDVTAKRMRLSLVQIAYTAEPVLIFDALENDLECIRPLVESGDIRMAAHNARFDAAVLTGAGFMPRGFVDTLTLARRALRLASYSLAAVAAELFGIAHDKTLQKSNWRRRPLTSAQLKYAAEDAALTLRVYEELTRRLEGSGKLNDALLSALLDMREAETRKPRVRRTVSLQLAPLSTEEKAVVTSLRRWRLDYSRLHHIPAYMICPDKTLEHLAQAKPTTLDALKTIYGLGESKIARFGAELLEALRDAPATDEQL